MWQAPQAATPAELLTAGKEKPGKGNIRKSQNFQGHLAEVQCQVNTGVHCQQARPDEQFRLPLKRHGL